MGFGDRELFAHRTREAHQLGAMFPADAPATIRSVLLWAAMSALFTGAAFSVAAEVRAPNLIVIYADDLGYGDLGCFGSKAIRTPNLDRMAREGMRLTSFYSVSPVCTPSRAALMTGRYAARMGSRQMHLSNVLTAADTTGLPQQETSIARALKQRGYVTACIGKWHLGHLSPHRPIDHGFDSYFGIPYSNDMKPSVLMRNSEIIEEPVVQDTLTQRYTEEALRFIDRSKDRPFFLYIAHTMPHIPLAASEHFRGHSLGGLYGDAVEELDWSAGQVVNKIRSLGLERNTVVIFASDNGPWYQGSPGLLRGRKGTTWEGGLRVPAIAWGPGRIRRGSVSDEPVATIDLFPTSLALAGYTDPEHAFIHPLDGKNILPLLREQSRKAPENIFLFFDGIYLQTARFGRWKIHVARWSIPRYTAASSQQQNRKLSNPELYDMSIDLAESYDLAARHPEIVRGIQNRIAQALGTFPDEIQQANKDLINR